MHKPQTKDKQLIDELKQKNSELEDEVARLESELIRTGKRLDIEYQRGFSRGHNEGSNKYLEILARQEHLKSTRILVVNNENFNTLREAIAYPDGPIIPITEEDKRRDREMIKAYIEKLPDDDFLKKHGGK